MHTVKRPAFRLNGRAAIEHARDHGADLYAFNQQVGWIKVGVATAVRILEHATATGSLYAVAGYFALPRRPIKTALPPGYRYGPAMVYDRGEWQPVAAWRA